MRHHAPVEVNIRLRDDASGFDSSKSKINPNERGKRRNGPHHRVPGSSIVLARNETQGIANHHKDMARDSIFFNANIGD